MTNLQITAEAKEWHRFMEKGEVFHKLESRILENS